MPVAPGIKVAFRYSVVDAVQPNKCLGVGISRSNRLENRLCVGEIYSGMFCIYCDEIKPSVGH